MSQQRHGYFHSESIHFRGSNISPPNVCTLVTASGHGTNLDSHYLLDAYDNGMMYGMTQYNGVQHQHNLDMGVPAAANIYYSSMNPSSGTAASLNAEVRRGNYQYFNASASSTVAPPNARHTENGIPSLPHCTSWSRSGESMMVRDPNRITRVNYLSQHFQPAAPPPWLDQQLNSNNNDGHALPWHQSLPMPYVQGKDVFLFSFLLFCGFLFKHIHVSVRSPTLRSRINYLMWYLSFEILPPNGLVFSSSLFYSM